MPINNKLHDQVVKFKIHNKSSYTNGWLSWEPALYNGTLHVNTFDNSIWLAGEHIASGYGFSSFQSYYSTFNFIYDSYAYTMDYIGRTYDNLYSSMMSYGSSTYNKLSNYIESSYEKLYSYVENSYAYSLNYTTEFCNSVNDNLSDKIEYVGTYLQNEVDDIYENYVAKEGEHANIDNTWVSFAGSNIYASDLFNSLLENPEYNKPELVLSSEPTNYSYIEVGSLFTTHIYFDCAYSYATPVYENNYTNENLGLSYGIKDISFVYNMGVNTYAPSSNVNSVRTTINDNYFKISMMYLGEDTTYNILSNITYNCLYASYMFYPQLLKNKKQLVCLGRDNTAWYGDLKLNTNNSIKFYARYKYYYGWDVAGTVDKDFNWLTDSSISFEEGWMSPGDESLTVSPKIDFSQDHKNLWIAFPMVTDTTHITTTEDFNILYHTPIIDQDLEADTMTIKDYTTTDYIGQCALHYGVHYIEFSDLYNDGVIEGIDGNYIQFTISRV